MIKLTVNRNGQIEAGQQDVSPTVYLDHWALRTFSEEPRLAARLVSVLKSRGGTLALSVLNLAEFTKVTDTQQAQKAEELVEAILPQVFFLEFEPFAVIDREDALLAGGPPIAPHGDVDFLRVFAGLKPTSVNPFTARNLFVAVQKPQLVTRLQGLADTIIDRIEALRDTLDADDGFRSKVKGLPPSFKIQRGTRIILRELIRPFLVDKWMNITPNHAIDLLHAVVPVAYCDIVLLDKHWETQVERARSRLTRAEILAPVARVFSGKGDKIDRFLCDLEGI